MKMTSNGRQPQYIKSEISQHTQILNLCFDVHTIFYKSLK
jgi:hypothetical protein